MNCALFSASITTRDWFIGTYSVRQIDLETDDVAMIASPLFGGPLVHLVKVSVQSRRGYGGFPDETWRGYSLNILALGPEDGSLVLEHLQDLLQAGLFPWPERELYRRYRDGELVEVEGWFEEPRLSASSAEYRGTRR